ncbi:autophagy protein [Coccomyxa subellipsoidea C-169]|uniref:Ubiquitin-like protein ATG12 n=1 Tax=Coccomyxa subellipsoidea (strain C-169) TaxID=574566 RepID=I0YLV6_COCSC|nr:autophagy protein [Coccomyxa subellipsoidea C-169]EIE19375.1 autophagy protein [Coccomyxa subellipsoidea C-169]|eukprot:XP_005643919.1 autophagy protein [Coccomyxa subellipsoidea C-169]
MSESKGNQVIVWLRATGDAPILKQQKVKISANEKFSKIVEVLRTKTKSEQVFVYLKESFCPSLDEKISVLYEAYGSEGRLTVNYANAPAWG